MLISCIKIKCDANFLHNCLRKLYSTESTVLTMAALLSKKFRFFSLLSSETVEPEQLRTKENNKRTIRS